MQQSNDQYYRDKASANHRVLTDRLYNLILYTGQVKYG